MRLAPPAVHLIASRSNVAQRGARGASWSADGRSSGVRAADSEPRSKWGRDTERRR
jgi:hypothetical protein